MRFCFLVVHHESVFVFNIVFFNTTPHGRISMTAGDGPKCEGRTHGFLFFPLNINFKTLTWCN